MSKAITSCLRRPQKLLRERLRQLRRLRQADKPSIADTAANSSPSSLEKAGASINASNKFLKDLLQQMASTALSKF
ncbi:hypothetical protein H1P_3200006 [Hyella patelloides LEGE 07179]|uniref:Uncharacterized protein n=1 Tax=Hyella patelloides LEGE 07179 TaxID=945734 RepID=A0A563VUY0_9CYAN|nr:hypothetical protein H1P_3200006 [Hyella patelloides LEGE 07179]